MRLVQPQQKSSSFELLDLFSPRDIVVKAGRQRLLEDQQLSRLKDGLAEMNLR